YTTSALAQSGNSSPCNEFGRNWGYSGRSPLKAVPPPRYHFAFRCDHGSLPRPNMEDLSMNPVSDPAKLKAEATYNAAADHFDDGPLGFWDRYGSRKALARAGIVGA